MAVFLHPWVARGAHTPPEARWQVMRDSRAGAFGIAGVVESFALFYVAERVFALNRELIQSMIYLKLSVAGTFTIYVTRTRGPFWSVRPAKPLFLAVSAAQLIATCAAVFGIFMTPIGWGWAAFVWAFAVAGFFIEDVVKLIVYRALDPKHPGLLARKH